MERTIHKRRAILTNDPSFTAWGWVILDFKGNILATGCIKTEPDYKKRRIRKGDDTIRRISIINNILIDLIEKWNVKFVLSELVHGSKNAQAAIMMGSVTAIVQSTCDALNISAEWYSEHDAKTNLFGKKKVTKQDMIAKIATLYDVPWTTVKYKDEAVADALAIHAVAMKTSTILKFLKHND